MLMDVSSQNKPDTSDDVPVPTSNTSPKLCREQQDLVDLIMGGHNVFFTGSAGCGKSTVLEAVVKELRAKRKQVNVIAPTGRAALQVNGMSTWSYIGWTPDFHKYSLEKLKSMGFRNYVADRLRGKGRNHYIHSTLDQSEWMYDFLGNYIVDITYIRPEWNGCTHMDLYVDL
jgi:Cdc6-like AAA superfamily ATPase